MTISQIFPELANMPDRIEELEDYQKDLGVLANENISIQFNNKGKEHATLVMSKIFACSNERLKIFARDFRGDISDNDFYIQNLRSFLEKSERSKVEVIFETEPNPNSKALDLLRKYKNKVSLKKADNKGLEEFRKYLVNEEKMIHFTIGDNAAGEFNKYRCETDTTQFVAILNFDDKQFCASLNKLFQLLDKTATKINN